MALFEIRAGIHCNENKAITQEEFRRVIEVPGNNPVNAVPFYAAQAVLNHCRAFSTRIEPKDNGKRLIPHTVEVYIFSPGVVSRTGYVSGNTGTKAAWEWRKGTTSMGLREWGNGFIDYLADDTERRIIALPLYGDEQDEAVYEQQRNRRLAANV